MEITDYLLYGKDNARSGRELAALMGIDIRSVTARIEGARRKGIPICAASHGKRPGYYIAENAEEFDAYCGCIRHRAGELLKTYRAMKATNQL